MMVNRAGVEEGVTCNTDKTRFLKEAWHTGLVHDTRTCYFFTSCIPLSSLNITGSTGVRLFHSDGHLQAF